MSPFGVNLGNAIYGNHIKMHEFDFNDGDAYRKIIPAGVPTIVMTHHSVEQIPDYRPILEGLLSCDEIVGVVHMEPAFPRPIYAGAWDYNRNMMEVLEGDPRVEILEVTKNVFGVNPANPTSVVRWRRK